MDGLNNLLATAQQHGEVDKICELIEECGGLDRIEDLQNHENEKVYQKALTIIQTYFNEEEDEVRFFKIFKEMSADDQHVCVLHIPTNIQMRDLT